MSYKTFHCRYDTPPLESEFLVNKLGCPRSFVGGMLHAIASDFSDMKTWE